MTADEISRLFDLLKDKVLLSEQGCSFTVCVQKVNGELLTLDNNLRKSAITKSVISKSHLWVFDLIIDEQKNTLAELYE